MDKRQREIEKAYLLYFYLLESKKEVESAFMPLYLKGYCDEHGLTAQGKQWAKNYLDSLDLKANAMLADAGL